MEKGAGLNGTSPAAKEQHEAEREARPPKTAEQRVTELEAQLACLRSEVEVQLACLISEIEAQLVRLGPEHEEVRRYVAEREARRYVAEREARPRQHVPAEQRVAELEAQVAFGRAVLAEARRYIALEEEDVVEEYRRAGKLHKYDPDKEWQKRLARVAKVYPLPEHMVEDIAEIAEYTKYLDEEED